MLPFTAWACIGCSTTENSLESGVAQSNAQDEKSPLSVEKLWEMKRIGSPVISPNGDWIVAPVTRYTMEDDKSHTDLWLFKSDGSVERPLTRHGSADGQPAFNPEGTKLAFVSRRDEDEAPQIYILPVSEPGEAVRHSEVPTGVSAIKWVGEHIYFISNVFPDKDWQEMKEKLEENQRSHVSAHKWTELPYSSWDRYLDEKRQAHVYRIHQDGGSEPEAITLPSGHQLPRSSQGTGSYDVSADESLVAFVSDTNRDDFNPKIDIYLIEPGSAQAENITPDNIGVDSNPRFSRNGRNLAYTSNNIPGFYADTNNLKVYNRQSGQTQNLTENWDRSVGSLVWDENNSSIYTSVSDAGTRRIYRIHRVSGEPRPITQNTDFPSFDVAGNGTLVAQNHSFLYPPQIHIVDTGDGSTNRIDSINDDVLADVELGTYESVTFTGADGKDIQMWVHYPPGFDESKTYPLFLLIHGGPHSGITDGFHFRWNAQTFASWGYVTAWHNFHGSDGFGQDFTDSINPDWISKPYEDTINAAEWFSNQSWIDADRMVAGGGSYGGYLSSILLGKDHPFNALLIHAPVYNMYSQMAADFAVHSARFGEYWEDDGSHFDGKTIYEKISPHYYAENFDTPALIIHGQNDLRVPVGQAFELFRTLQSKGIDSRLIYYPDENHWILKPNNSVYWYHQVRDWVEKYAEPGGR